MELAQLLRHDGGVWMRAGSAAERVLMERRNWMIVGLAVAALAGCSSPGNNVGAPETGAPDTGTMPKADAGTGKKDAGKDASTPVKDAGHVTAMDAGTDVAVHHEAGPTSTVCVFNQDGSTFNGGCTFGN